MEEWLDTLFEKLPNGQVRVNTSVLIENDPEKYKNSMRTSKYNLQAISSAYDTLQKCDEKSILKSIAHNFLIEAFAAWNKEDAIREMYLQKNYAIIKKNMENVSFGEILCRSPAEIEKLDTCSEDSLRYQTKIKETEMLYEKAIQVQQDLRKQIEMQSMAHYKELQDIQAKNKEELGRIQYANDMYMQSIRSEIKNECSLKDTQILVAKKEVETCKINANKEISSLKQEMVENEANLNTTFQYKFDQVQKDMQKENTKQIQREKETFSREKKRLQDEFSLYKKEGEDQKQVLQKTERTLLEQNYILGKEVRANHQQLKNAENGIRLRDERLVSLNKDFLNALEEVKNLQLIISAQSTMKLDDLKKQHEESLERKKLQTKIDVMKSQESCVLM